MPSRSRFLFVGTLGGNFISFGYCCGLLCPLARSGFECFALGINRRTVLGVDHATFWALVVWALIFGLADVAAFRALHDGLLFSDDRILKQRALSPLTLQTPHLTDDLIDLLQADPFALGEGVRVDPASVAPDAAVAQGALERDAPR